MNSIRSSSPQCRPVAGQTILAEGEYCSFNDITGGLNDNVLVVGGSGTGKTRGVVRPNILQTAGSYIISDPKGNLYNLYHHYLRLRGYRVERLDFVHPERSTVKYNFFNYIRNQTDVLKVTHVLCGPTSGGLKDRFWDQSAEVLIEGIIDYVLQSMPEQYRNLGEVLALLRAGTRSESSSLQFNSRLDQLMQSYMFIEPDSLGAHCYESIRMNPTRTWNCVISTALAKYAAFDTKEITDLLSEDTVYFSSIGKQKTAIFVVVSDTDRSMDTLANVFFSQTMQELCRAADARPDSRLQIPVRFILDDFATNVRIDEFPRMISSIRSRGISTMLMVQAEAQLESGYGTDAGTIISNCDTYIYLGGNDIATARAVGQRCDLPMLDILNMPVGTCWVFRRGQAAHRSHVFPLEPFEREKMGKERER